MKVKIEFLRDDAEKDMAASVETQHRRGDTFTIHKADMLMNGESTTLLVPSSGRLVINMPTATEKPVYDREQGAAVLPSAQRQGTEGADRPNPAEVIATKERELEELKRAENDRREKERLAAEQEAEADRAAQQAKTGTQTATMPTSTRTPPQGGQPLTGQTARTPAANTSSAQVKGSTVDASKAPNPSPGAQPSTSTTGSSGGNTEKK